MSAATEPLPGPYGVLPLGASREPGPRPHQPPARPFGLRFAAQPLPSRTVPVVDFSTWSYDAERQSAVVAEGDDRVPAARHSTGATQTPTNTGDGTRFERDDDVTED